MYTPQNIHESPYFKNVLRGMAWLDEHRENTRWYNEIDLNTLDCHVTKQDPFGQLDVPTSQVSPTDEDLGRGLSLINNKDSNTNYKTLTETWKTLIELRRQLPPVPKGWVFVGLGGHHACEQWFTDGAYRYCFKPSGRVWGNKWSDRIGSNPEDFIITRAAFILPCDSRTITEWLYNASKENRTMNTGCHIINENSPKIAIGKETGDLYYDGYEVPFSDIKEFMKWLENTPDLAGENVQINEISVGCQTIEYQHLHNIIHAYSEEVWKKSTNPTVQVGTEFDWEDSTYRLVLTEHGYDIFITALNTREFTRYHSSHKINPDHECPQKLQWEDLQASYTVPPFDEISNLRGAV
jgi:hypothetical protein